MRAWREQDKPRLSLCELDTLLALLKPVTGQRVFASFAVEPKYLMHAEHLLHHLSAYMMWAVSFWRHQFS